MAVFTQNQVRHLYVVKSVKTGATTLTTTGDIKLVEPENSKEIYFQYFGVDGLQRTDLIHKDKILYITATGADKMQYGLKRFEVKLDANVSAEPVASQEYIIRLAFRQYIGLSDEDQYFKYGSVVATPSMTASDLYKRLAMSLAKNVANETTPLVNIYIGATQITDKTKFEDIAGDATSIIIEQAIQDWHLGLMQENFIPFTVQFLPIIVDGEYFLWGAVEEVEATNFVNNGHNIADMEYFYMGNRGDYYRMMGFPNIVPTKYLVDPTKAYDSIDIHFAFTDTNESVQKSEKTITLVGEDGVLDSLLASLGALVDETLSFD